VTHTQRVPSNVSWGYFGRKRAERAEAQRQQLSAKAIVEAQWRIVDALEELPMAAQQAALHMALQTLDIASAGSEE